MKKTPVLALILMFLLMLPLLFCAACAGEKEPPPDAAVTGSEEDAALAENDTNERPGQISAEDILSAYYAGKGVTEQQIADLPEVEILSPQGDLTLPIPGYWQEYGLCRVDRYVDDHLLFTLYEPYTQESYFPEAGREWSLLRYTYADYAARFTDWPLPEAYELVFGAAFYIIGTDQQYVYLLDLPTDAQFDPDDALSAALFAMLQEGSQSIIERFMEINGITPNLSCPDNECYKANLIDQASMVQEKA